MQRDYSFIIPVFNRPQEIQELLMSFAEMSTKIPFEVVIVEDGSTIDSHKVVKSFEDSLNINYHQKQNTGPGDSRNVGMQIAKGSYFIILDSDCIVPKEYLQVVDSFLNSDYVDCYGGADAAHNEFSPLQKAINYVMTSFLTTGGIRGSKMAVQKFEPRSFNMGISKDVFKATNGFAKIHPGEDPDLSQRIKKLGFKTAFIPNAFVYHKRRISWDKFYTQVNKFGLVRPILNMWHPKAAKLTFWFPTLFIVFVIASVISLILFHYILIAPLLLYILIVFMDSAVKNKSLYIGLLTIRALFVQFFGYGRGFLISTYYIGWLKRDPEKKFPQLFFK
ncbi:MAG: glycosyltransferase [Patiriisocius sp.]|uniref:glycosyltransferase n=1 Tax=Patiriisocius sp. TaxID=2822396 RepID=UPI003EF61DCF